MLPIMGLERTPGLMPDQNFLKDIDKLIPKKVILIIISKSNISISTRN
jgi:hypothetical protein